MYMVEAETRLLYRNKRNIPHTALDCIPLASIRACFRKVRLRFVGVVNRRRERRSTVSAYLECASNILFRTRAVAVTGFNQFSPVTHRQTLIVSSHAEPTFHAFPETYHFQYTHYNNSVLLQYANYLLATRSLGANKRDMLIFICKGRLLG